MSTILFNEIVFGPIKSRRLGRSLGINLLPRHGKWCNFNCVYCECGWNKDGRADKTLPTVEEVETALDLKLQNILKGGTSIDTITFSGNGEPTMHPDFGKIIDITIRLRDRYFPAAKISVLSNATQLSRPEVLNALRRIDNPILKIDGSSDEFISIVDDPQGNYSLSRTIELMKLFEGNFVLQTMFLRGEINGVKVDSTDPKLVEDWYDIVRELNPREIMIYTIDRETPLKTLEKVTVSDMEEIAAPLIKEGFNIKISG